MAHKGLENAGFTVKDNGKIDFRKPPEGKVFVPIPTDKEDIRRRGIDQRFVTKHTFSGTTMLVVMELIDAEDEEKAKDYIMDIKRECKREERKRRCTILNEKTGQLRYCPDCLSCYGEDCPKKHGLAVEEDSLTSYEELVDAIKYSAYSQDPTADEAIINVMWDDFKTELSTEKEPFLKMIELNEQGYAPQEIMDRLGRSKTWYYRSWKMIRSRWINYNKD